MARGPIFEGNYKVHFLPTVADISAPTVAEFTAGDYLGRVVTKDGTSLGISQNRVDVASIDELFDGQRMGSWGASPSLTLFRDDASEVDGWDIVANGTLGYLAIVPWVAVQAAAGMPAAGDPAYVFPAEMGVAQPADSSANSPQTFTVDFAVTSEPNIDALVAI